MGFALVIRGEASFKDNWTYEKVRQTKNGVVVKIESEYLNEKLVEGWAELIELLGNLFIWNWFATFTFRVAIHPESARKAFDRFIHILNRKTYGVHYYKRDQRVAWILSQENHKFRDVIHYHSLIGNFDKYIVDRYEMARYWEELAGFARIFEYDGNKGARYYLAKYVGKDGKIDIDYPGYFPGERNQAVLPGSAAGMVVQLAAAKRKADRVF